jgi:hypothetical protein
MIDGRGGKAGIREPSLPAMLNIIACVTARCAIYKIFMKYQQVGWLIKLSSKLRIFDSAMGGHRAAVFSPYARARRLFNNLLWFGFPRQGSLHWRFWDNPYFLMR